MVQETWRCVFHEWMVAKENPLLLSVDWVEKKFENYLLLNILTMQHGFLLLQPWLLSPEHLVHYYHLSHALWNDIFYSADNFETCCKRESDFHFLPKKFTYLVWCLVCCIKWLCCNGLIFVVRTVLCCHVRSLLASPLRFWVLFCVLFLNMCLCKLQICAGCSELLLLKSVSLARCILLHLRRFSKAGVWFSKALWLPWATKKHPCLRQCWVSLSKQNAASWALGVLCIKSVAEGEQMSRCDLYFSSLYSFGEASESLFFSKNVWI